jgi:hypothetical protein
MHEIRKSTTTLMMHQMVPVQMNAFLHSLRHVIDCRLDVVHLLVPESLEGVDQRVS